MAAHQTHSYPVIQTIVILGKPSSQSNRRPARPRSLKPQTGKRWGIGPMPYNLDLLPHEARAQWMKQLSDAAAAYVGVQRVVINCIKAIYTSYQVGDQKGAKDGEKHAWDLLAARYPQGVPQDVEDWLTGAIEQAKDDAQRHGIPAQDRILELEERLRVLEASTTPQIEDKSAATKKLVKVEWKR